MAILIREDTLYETVEVVAIQITKSFDPLTCISIYVPPDRETKEKIMQLFIVLEDFRGEIIIIVDWIGHRRTWDPTGGIPMNGIIEASRFTHINDGSHAYLTTTERRSSTVDLTVATPGIAVKTNWKVDEQEFGSIHFAILIEIG